MAGMPQATIASNAAVSAAGPLPAVALGALSDYTLTLEVVNLTASRIRVGFEDSADGTTWEPLAVWIFAGPASDNTKSLRAYDAPGLKTHIRVNVYEIVGGTASINSAIY